VALTKDDIDAVSMMLHVDGKLAFSILLTRGGLTQRLGSSDAATPAAIMIKGRTDECFEGFMVTLSESVLVGGGDIEDGGRQGRRHEWRFEFGGGMESLAWNIAYHDGSAALPDEFADMVVQAERLTHQWYLKGVAEETGQPLPEPPAATSAPAPRSAPSAPQAKKSTPRPSAPQRRPGAGGVRGRGAPVPLKRDRMALVALIDLIAFTLPWSFLQWIFGAGGPDRTGPPGAGLVLFAIFEAVLLLIARRSPGYWLMGVSAELGQKPMVDPVHLARENQWTVATGIGLCALGVGGLTSWAAYHTPIPYFGLGLPFVLSLGLTLILSVGLVLGGVLVLRLDVRGVWIGGGIALLLLASAALGWSEWAGFVDAVVADRSAEVGGPVGEGLVGGLVRTFTPYLIAVVPAALLAGTGLAWKRITGPAVAGARATPVAS